jgi:hypothetical protein
MAWVAIAAGVAFCIVGLIAAARVARSNAAFRRAQAEAQPRLAAGTAAVEAAAARLQRAAAVTGTRAGSASEAADGLARSAARLHVLGQAGGEGFAALRGLRRWVDPAG